MLQRGAYGETYNIGGDNERKNLDVVTLICKIINEFFAQSLELRHLFPDSPCAKGADSNLLVTFVKDRLGHDVRYAIDASKIKKELGFSASINFEKGIRDTVKWYLDNQDWWMSILGRE